MKRFTETTKWDDPWFLDLSPGAKILWLYICDKCDNAGVIDLHERKACFELGVVSITEYIEEIKSRIEFMDNGKFFIKSFIDFQYGELKENSNLHKSVINILKNHRLPNPSDTHQDGIMMTPSKGKGKGKGKVNVLSESIYKVYPIHVGKVKALESISKALEKVDYDYLLDSVQEYASAMDGFPDKTKIPHPSTWFNQERWEDDKEMWSAWKKESTPKEEQVFTGWLPNGANL